MFDELALAAVPLVTAAGAWWSIRRIARTPTPPAAEPYRLTYRVDWPKEPWRTHPDAAVTEPLPVWWLRSIADPAELAKAATHDYRIDTLRASIDDIGITTPLVMNIDQLGRICLADGHHRLVIATELGLAEAPVTPKTVARIGGYGVPVGPAVTSLLTRIPADPSRDRFRVRLSELSPDRS